MKPEMRILSNGIKEWRLNDKPHREDGPAVICPDGYKLWYLNGEFQFAYQDFRGKLIVWEIGVV